jgi:hypothetical protein
MTNDRKNWEEELDVLFGKLWLPTDGEGKFGAVNTLTKEFIRTLLKDQKEEVERIILDKISELVEIGETKETLPAIDACLVAIQALKEVHSSLQDPTT